MRAPVGTGRLETAADQTRFVLQALSRIRSLPGVKDASTTIKLPGFSGFGSAFDVPGIAHPDKWRGALEFCSDGYFRTLGVPLLQGRDFTLDDLTRDHAVVVVNRLFVDRFLGRADPIGRTMLIALRAPSGGIEDKPFRIIGVVENVKNNGVSEPIEPEAFLPQSAGAVRSISFVVRTSGHPLLARKAIQHEIWAVDPAVPIAESDTLEGYLALYAFAAPRLGLGVFTAFASIGLVLVVVGVYGLIAYTVSCQTREIGIRIAIGAARADVLRLTIGLAARWLTAGAAIGVVASYLTTRFVASQLYQVSPTDPATFVAVIALLVMAGLAASYVPARRATRVDPMVVLRTE
jgi:predicted permease